jgi:hypothetical protein
MKKKAIKRRGLFFCNFNQFYFFTLFHAKQKKEPFLIVKMNDCRPNSAETPLGTNSLNRVPVCPLVLPWQEKERDDLFPKKIGLLIERSFESRLLIIEKTTTMVIFHDV